MLRNKVRVYSSRGESSFKGMNLHSTIQETPKLNSPLGIKNYLWVGFFYLLSAEFLLYLSFQNINSSIAWPAAGVSFVAWYFYGKKVAPAIFIVSLAANYTFLSSFGLPLGTFTG